MTAVTSRAVEGAARGNPRTWTLHVFAPVDRNTGRARWLTMNNSRDHRMVVASRVNAWRRAVRDAAIIAGLAKLDGSPTIAFGRARIDVQITPKGGARRDPSNWHPTAKACVDMLTADTKRVPKVPSIGVLPDDSPQYLHCQECPHVTLAAPLTVATARGSAGHVTITITDLSEETPCPAR